jgi:hypothetical protein
MNDISTLVFKHTGDRGEHASLLDRLYQRRNRSAPQINRFCELCCNKQKTAKFLMNRCVIPLLRLEGDGYDFLKFAARDAWHHHR